MADTHPHSHDDVQVREVGPRAPRKPSPDSIIANQSSELARINDNRIYLLALIDDFQADLNGALIENASLKERVEHLQAELDKLQPPQAANAPQVAQNGKLAAAPPMDVAAPDPTP